MRRFRDTTVRVFLVGLTVAIGTALTGCPSPQAPDPDNGIPEGMSKVYVLLSAAPDECSECDKEKNSSEHIVPREDITSLMVTLTSVALNKASDVYDDDGEDEDGDDVEEGDEGDDGENEGDDDGQVGHAKHNDDDEYDDNSQVVVFTGAVDVELMNLADVSALLASAEIYGGRYNKIRLSVENPRLILAEKPDEVITDVKLTANGRLFISGHFELTEGESQLVLLDLKKLHLVETGKCKYVLTPQLRAEINTVGTHAVAAGRIMDLDAAADKMTLVLGDGTPITVVYTGASIFLDSDGDTPTGSEASLALDQEIQVEGSLWVDGSMNAETVLILPPTVETPAE